MGRRGFSLIELLIVATIILIIAAIAIPNLLRSKMAANEASCVGTLRVLNNSEVTYNMTYNSGFTGGLNVLGPPPSGQQPTYLNADLVDRNLAGLEQLGSDTGFVKSGYIFTIGNCTKVTVNGTDRITSYTVTAVPQTVGKTGDSGYCSDQFGSIKYDPTGSTNCTQLVQ